MWLHTLRLRLLQLPGLMWPLLLRRLLRHRLQTSRAAAAAAAGLVEQEQHPVQSAQVTAAAGLTT